MLQGQLIDIMDRSRVKGPRASILYDREKFWKISEDIEQNFS